MALLYHYLCEMGNFNNLLTPMPTEEGGISFFICLLHNRIKAPNIFFTQKTRMFVFESLPVRVINFRNWFLYDFKFGSSKTLIVKYYLLLPIL